MSRLVRSEPLSKPQKERLDKLDAAAMHLNATINDILDLSKIEAGRLDLSDGPVHLQALVSSVMDMVQDRATAKRIALHSAVDSTSDQLYGDETRLKQSLLNYAGNAIKFTESGTITLGVSIAEENEASALLRFEVCDSGIGITEVHRSKLFTPFEQVDNGTSRKYGGTGLGLAITKKLAEAMGGEVGVASSLGVGSTFWFTACLRKGARVAPETEALDARDPKLVLQQDYRGRCVLLAEDDAFNQEIGRIVLEDVGFAVDVAEDGLAAVALAARNAYDLILMDIQMPNLDGLGATQQIRQIPSCRAIPIVAMTANAFEEDRLHCLEAGMNDFVTKPMEPRVLYAAIVRWLKHKAVTEKGDS
jgi:CheY-like chemotaxis protein